MSHPVRRFVQTASGRLPVGFVLAIALVARLAPGPRLIDDAFITFRYARHLVEGAGFVYNAGERVLGTTTPLYTLLLAGLSLTTGSRDFPALALAVNALAGVAGVYLLYRLGWQFAGRRAVGLAAALLWAVAPYSVTFAVGGMETDLTIALLLGCFLAHLGRRSRAGAVLAALAFLARPDTLIATGLIYLDLLLAVRRGAHAEARRRLPWREGLVALGVAVPWLLFATLYFGRPLPRSMAAKAAAYRLPPEAGLIRLLQHYATPFFEFEVLPPLGVVLVFGLYVGLSALGAWAAFRRDRRTWPVSLYPLAYFVVFAAANPLLFRWYLSPPLPFYFLLILAGIRTLAGDLSKLVARRATVEAHRPVRGVSDADTLLALFTLAALVLTLNAWELHPDHGPDRPAPEMAWFKLEQLYARAAEVVSERARPGDSLCAGDIGVLGYRTGLRILDTVGLVTDEAARHYPADPALYVINYAIPADLVLALNADYVVILEVYGRRGLLPDPRFQARYRLLKRMETDIYGSEGMLIFERVVPRRGEPAAGHSPPPTGRKRPRPAETPAA